MNDQDKQQTASSLLSIVILGIATLLLFQYFNIFEKQPQTIQNISIDESGQNLERDDFEFKKIKREEKIIVENQRNIFILNTKGGRIDRVYIKENDNLKIPNSVIESSQDELEKNKRALEITRNKGMDFQLHLYFRDKTQLKSPFLNESIFDYEKWEDNKTTTIVFYNQIKFRDNDFTLYKIYRFLKTENFFHHITILKNDSDKDFILGGDLFYKTFSTIGPEPEDLENSRILASFGRFYNYDNSLKTLPAFGASGGFFCNGNQRGDFQIITEKPNSLKYLGANSRYFISYSQFLPSSDHHLPDGIVVLNHPPLDGTASFTTVFLDFKLSPKKEDDLNLIRYLKSQKVESISGLKVFLDKDKQRNDLLILDQIVYTGLKSDEEHKFFDKEIAKFEFDLDFPESTVRDVIYTSGFLALFSKLRDGIVISMRFINNYVNNYGFVIILIALIIKILTYPLNQVQAKTMKKIHLLKPEMDRINEKYQDPAERQKKIMDLYKKYKINPAMGCLPILIQIPIFIALYSAFSESIELWKSPFIWWMKDLSQPDTIYVIKDMVIIHNFHINILPLAMVGSQFLLQKYTTVTSDPQQKFLIYFMPVLMIFFFWNMPSGVTLYWTVQNIISVVWQIVVEKFSKEDIVK